MLSRVDRVPVYSLKRDFHIKCLQATFHGLLPAVEFKNFSGRAIQQILFFTSLPVDKGLDGKVMVQLRLLVYYNIPVEKMIED